MKFEYQAIDENGGVVRGIVEAASTERVQLILLAKQLHPIDMRELTESTVELGRLNNLKSRLQGKKKQSQARKPQKVEHMEAKDKKKLDLTYPVFICITGGIIALSILHELGLLL